MGQDGLQVTEEVELKNSQTLGGQILPLLADMRSCVRMMCQQVKQTFEHF